MKKIFVLIACILMAACSAIPFSTLAKLRNFSAEDFVAMTPQEVFMRIAVPQGYTLDIRESNIGITLIADNEESFTELSMAVLTQQEKEQLARKAEWDPQANEYLFKLDERGVQNFYKLQRIVSSIDTDSVKIDIGFEPKTWPPEAEVFPVTVDLQFFRQDGFFRMIDNGGLPIDTFLEAKAASQTE